ncbi:MAG: hypothetical protein M3Y58_18520 [Chloroflexota bacterium]|nr:hypothetical protein [Chloroflexota bacterium]
MARVAFHETEVHHPTIEAHDRFTDQEDHAAYAARYRQSFIALVGERGREATTYDEQNEAARLDAEAIVANPRFHMTYQHHDREKNVLMVQAMLYWRNYKDILPPDEVTERAERYLHSLPLLGRLRMRRTIWQRSRIRSISAIGERNA